MPVHTEVIMNGGMEVYMYMCIDVFMSVHIYVCMNVCVDSPQCLSVSIRHESLCIYVGTYVCTYIARAW